MSDAMLCDRCEKAVSRKKWAHNTRAEIKTMETSRAATAYNPSEWELCRECTDDLYDFMSV